MLRLEIHLPGGPPQWLLISQIEHARLSGQIATRFLPIQIHNQKEPFCEALLTAISHHDDGWADWDAAPGLDEQGRPRSFKEMHLADSLRIWTASINSTEPHDPLAAYLVADHFIKLLSDSDSAAEGRLAEDWRTDMAERMIAWRGTRDANFFSAACQWLPAFDALSLWMCGAILTEERQFVLLPGHFAETTFTRIGPFVDRCFTADPWRFDEATIKLSVNALRTPIKRYETAESLMAASQPQTLSWELHR